MFETELREDGTAQLKTTAELERTRAELVGARTEARRYARQLTEERAAHADAKARILRLARELENTVFEAGRRLDEQHDTVTALRIRVDLFRKKVEIADAIVERLDDVFAGSLTARIEVDELLGRWERLAASVRDDVQHDATQRDGGEE
jgi:hypothetical protein